jgi:Na+-transporting methylmalonyl-CoA/oxaloacetate decarboxylase gamma subunit
MWEQAVLIAAVGFGVVFVVLALLLVSMRVVGAVMSSKSTKKAEAAK